MKIVKGKIKESVAEMKKTKFQASKEGWKKATPAMWRRIGETVNVMCSMVAVSIYADIHWVAVTIFILGLLSRGIVEFFISE